MVLWLALAALTAAVLLAVLRPLLRAEPGVPATHDADSAVYRHQLAELEVERGRGLIADAEADAARNEIARRLLASAERTQVSSAERTQATSAQGMQSTSAQGMQSTSAERMHVRSRKRVRVKSVGGTPAVAGAVESAATPTDHGVRWTAVGIALVMPLSAVALYVVLGSPGMPGFPRAARVDAPIGTAQLTELIGRVEQRLRQHPDDGEGWDVIAPVYLKLGRYQDAAAAFEKAIAARGESEARLAGFAEASVLARDGIVTGPAREAYAKLLRLTPGRPEPRFWLAVAKEQDGHLAEALQDYRSLLRDADQKAAWRGPVAERVAKIEARLAGNGEAAPGPTAEDIAAAARLSPEARSQSIDRMVAGLAERLKKDGADLHGWQRLIRAYTVLGRNEDAQAALADARRNLAREPASLKQLDALAQTLGLGS